MMQTSLLPMLHAQYCYYTNELADTHKQMSKQYNKMASAELDLLSRHEKELTRKEKKRAQWTRTQAKATVKALQSQQAWLHDYLRQCTNLIASCEASLYSPSVTPRSALPLPDPLSQTSGLTIPLPWSPIPSTSYDPQNQPTPHYWDLSMLRERRESSPFTPSWSADSGFYETSNTHTFDPESFHNPFVAGMEIGTTIAAALPSPPRKKSSISERDDFPELNEPIVSPTRSGASPHKRRFSENAIQQIESRFSLPKQKHHRRGNSASATPVSQRRLSVQPDVM